MKVWDRAGIELGAPGSSVRLASVARHVTDCATQPGKISVVKTYTGKRCTVWYVPKSWSLNNNLNIASKTFKADSLLAVTTNILVHWVSLIKSNKKKIWNFLDNFLKYKGIPHPWASDLWTKAISEATHKLQKWASSQQNLSSGFPTKRVLNQSPQLQGLARKLNFQL